MKISVCIEMFWQNKNIEDKIEEVAKAGFPAIEFWNWSDKNIEGIRKAKEKAGLEVAAFCLEPVFCLTADGNEPELLKGAKESVKTAHLLNCKTLIATTGNIPAGDTFETARKKGVGKLKSLSKIAEDNGITLVLEPLNSIVNHPGYLLTRSCEAADIIREVNSSGLKMLFDIYHQQITEGNILYNIDRYIRLIGHFHCAGVPGRNELSGGELDYGNIFAAIDKAGYENYVGLELTPKRGEAFALKQVQKLI